MLANFTTLPHFSVSSAMSFPKSGGELAFNRIWGLMQRGKGVHEDLEGWQKAYQQMRPYVGPVLHFLRMVLSSGGDGTPPPRLL
jgi:hypothetical protein